MHTSKFIPMDRLGEAVNWQFASIDNADSGAKRAPARKATFQERTGFGYASTTNANASDAGANEHIPEEDPISLAAYQRGLKQGLAEGFRAGVAQQKQEQAGFGAANAARMDAVIASMQSQFDAMDRDVTHALTNLAFSIARQVIRQELSTSPDAIVNVVREALSTLGSRAGQPTIHLNPSDIALMADANRANPDTNILRGCTIEADRSITRGGCKVVSDLATIDATLETRWQRTLASMGYDAALVNVAPAPSESE
jgi:flagellar assembly protein FliH